MGLKCHLADRHGILTPSSLVAQTVKNLPAMEETWVGKILWRRKWQPTPVFLSGKFHGQRSLVGHSPRGCERVRYDLATKQQFL